MDTKKMNYILKTLRICGTSLVSKSDNSLPFILLLIFSHSEAHVGHAFEDLFKSTS